MNMRDTLFTRFPSLLFLVVVISSCGSTTEDLTVALAERMQLESGRLTATGYADIVFNLEIQVSNEFSQSVLLNRCIPFFVRTNIWALH